MRGMNKGLLTWACAALLVVAVSCTGNALDDGGSANVVLQVQEVTIPPVQSQPDPVGGGCVFLLTEATATLNNVPKSDFEEGSPFADIIITSLTISYVWDDPAITTPPYTTSERVVIPVDGTNQVKFLAIPLTELDVTKEGHSAELTMLFRGHTEAGSAVEAVGGGVLIVNSCIQIGP